MLGVFIIFHRRSDEDVTLYSWFIVIRLVRAYFHRRIYVYVTRTRVTGETFGSRLPRRVIVPIGLRDIIKTLEDGQSAQRTIFEPLSRDVVLGFSSISCTYYLYTHLNVQNTRMCFEINKIHRFRTWFVIKLSVRKGKCGVSTKNKK